MSGFAFSLRRQGAVSKALSWLLCGCLLNPGLALANLPVTTQLPADLLAELKSEQQDLGQLFLGDALLDRLDYDAATIVAFVRDQIAYQSYPGVLRGIDATLAGRAGNAHDQALTLAGLLKDAGYEAQILAAEISRTQAEQLHAAIAVANLPDAASSSLAIQASARLKASGQIQDTTVQGLLSETLAATQSLQDLVHQTDFGTNLHAMEELSIASATSYRWVRYRSAAGDPWIDAHPAFPAAADWELKAAKISADAIANEDLQTLAVEVWIADSEGNETLVSGDWKAPTANLHGRPIELEFVSNSMIEGVGLGDMESLVANSRYFFVQLNGSLQEGGLVFDLQGNTYPGDSVAGLNTVFATLNATGLRAADALSDLGSTTDRAAPRQALTKVWVNFVMRAPGRAPRSVQRIVYDAEHDAGSNYVATKLIQRWDIDVATTVAGPAWHRYQKSIALHAAIIGYQKFEQVTQAKVKASNTDDVSSYAQALVEHMPRPQRGRLSYLRTLFDQFEVGVDEVRYPTEPNILSIRSGVEQSDQLWGRYSMTDIVSNVQSAFRVSDGAWASAPLLNVQRGIWETRAETLHMLDAPPSVSHTSAYQQLSTKEPLEILPSSAPGSAMIAPKGFQTIPAWWQIDLETGSAIGMATVGPGTGGVEVTEELLLNVLPVLLSAVFWAVAMETCIQGGGDRLCCITVNGAIALVGFAVSWAVGIIAVAAAGGAAFGAAAGPSMLSAITSVLADLGLTLAPVNCT